MATILLTAGQGDSPSALACCILPMKRLNTYPPLFEYPVVGKGVDGGIFFVVSDFLKITGSALVQN